VRHRYDAEEVAEYHAAMAGEWSMRTRRARGGRAGALQGRAQRTREACS